MVSEYKSVNQIQITRKELAAGSYYLCFKIGENLIRKKIIIK